MKFPREGRLVLLNEIHQLLLHTGHFAAKYGVIRFLSFRSGVNELRAELIDSLLVLLRCDQELERTVLDDDQTGA